MRRALFLIALCAASLPCTAALRSPAQVLSPQNTPESASAHVPRISGGVMAGNNISKVPPVYPADAKASGVQGTVVLHVIIGQDGYVQTVTAVSGPEALRQAAIDAVSQWVYKPYILNGQPIAVDTTVMVNFSLNG